jgi:hypothetical protein
MTAIADKTLPIGGHYYMNADWVSYETPEERELQKKLYELEILEAKLTQKELDLATFQAQLHTFEREYLQVIGSRYTELDRIEAQIAEYANYLESEKNFQPSDSLKKLYREIAKKIHPDLATDPKERSRRQKLMAEVNHAYEIGDVAKLKAILVEWQASAESVGEQRAAVSVELIRAIGKIARVQERLKAIEEQIESLAQTELNQLKMQISSAKQAGRNLFAEMAGELDRQIFIAQQQLTVLKEKLEA